MGESRASQLWSSLDSRGAKGHEPVAAGSSKGKPEWQMYRDEMGITPKESHADIMVKAVASAVDSTVGCKRETIAGSRLLKRGLSWRNTMGKQDDLVYSY